MGIVDNIVGRCSVGDSDREVCRRVYLALKKKARRDPAMKEARKELYRQAIAAHAANKKIYSDFRF